MKRSRHQRRLLAARLFAGLAVSLQAQTLAHRNWAGNGLTTTPWWQNAVIYSVDVASFQDSDGDGKGDLPGLTQRFAYLQSLGVDAILLRSDRSTDGFDDLLRVANAHHLRILVSLAADDPHMLDTARQWLTRGAAGLELPESANGTLPLVELRRLTTGFPGDRILIAAPIPGTGNTPPDAAQLTTELLRFPQPILDAFYTSTVWKQPPPPLPRGTAPLLHSLGDVLPLMFGEGSRGMGLEKISAARLLLRPGATLLSYGEEVGMAGHLSSQPGGTLMPWTPTDRTVVPKPEEPPAASTAPDPRTYNADNYTGYKPYVAPRPTPKQRPQGAPPDPSTLPGFGSQLNDAYLSPNIATANVATEDADPLSLLNFYRRLSQLHHDHPALRSGVITDIDLSAQKAFAWIIKAPANTRTARSILVVANFSDQAQTLNLDTAVSSFHLRPGGLRPLLASWIVSPPFQYTSHVAIPPFSVYVAEL